MLNEIDSTSLCAEKLGIRALLTVEERYEQNLDSESKYPYHNSAHSNLVAERTLLICQAMLEGEPGIITPRELALGVLAARSHDRIITWEKAQSVNENGLTVVKMKRHIGENEKRSADELIIEMREENIKFGCPVFVAEDENLVQEAILATIPGFDASLMTVVQPNLTRDSYPVTRAVALADIGSAGLSPQRFALDGVELFREENLDVFEALTGDEPLSPAFMKLTKERMLEWGILQIKFAQGRKEMLKKELEGLPKVAKREIRRLFYHFDNSIAQARKIAEKRAQMSFVELVADFGYLTDNRSYLINRVLFT